MFVKQLIFKVKTPVILAFLLFSFNMDVFSNEQSLIEKQRLVVTNNLQLLGEKLAKITQTTFSNCETYCRSQNNCQGFSFEFRKNNCHPIKIITGQRNLADVSSGRLVPVEPHIVNSASERANELDFLPQHLILNASQFAVQFSQRFPSDHRADEDITHQLLQASADKHFRQAFKYAAMLTAKLDRADLWVETARLALSITSGNQTDVRRYRKMALSLSINAFLRSVNSEVKANALIVLANALEKQYYPELSIPALRLSQSFSPRLETEEAIVRAISLYGFRVLEHTVENNSSIPRVCLQFSENLVSEGIDYSDYIRFPAIGLSTEADNNQLCIDGVQHGAHYQFTIRKGLPAASGEKLVKSIDLNIYVKDREPKISFNGRSYVLPKSKNASIPVNTVNVSSVDLNIYRIGDRNILRSIQQRYFSKSLSSYDQSELSGNLGELVWSGKGEIDSVLNDDITTALPLGDAIAEFESGVYVMQGQVWQSQDYVTAEATQWFIVTDIGISTMMAKDGLHVFLRSLYSADGLANVDVELVAQNNTILGTSITDENGYAHFPAGKTRGIAGRSPALLTVSNGSSDFSFIDLKEAAFDLSDRGVEGREAPSPIDVFLTLDRGVYGVGEDVNATILVRDDNAKAISGFPLTAIVRRPDGVEYLRSIVPDRGAGGRVFSVELGDDVQRGFWYLELYGDVDSRPLSSKNFLVEDFTPERLDFELSYADEKVDLVNQAALNVTAHYLYGAPGGDLLVEGEIQIEPKTFIDAFPGYHFGTSKEDFSSQTEYLSTHYTNSDGVAEILMPRLSIPESTRPLQLNATVRVREGSGRPVERHISKDIVFKQQKVAIKPLFSKGLDEDDIANFHLVLVGEDLKTVENTDLQWRVNRLTTRYQWYERYGNWDYEPITTRERIDSGVINLSKDNDNILSVPVTWGRYELVVSSATQRLSRATYPFSAGWYAPVTGGDAPDILEVGLDKSIYKVGDEAVLRLVPKFAGKGLITVTNNRLIEKKVIDVQAGENLVSLPITEQWGTGAYVTATVLRGMDIAAGHNPVRALGLQWLEVDPEKHQLRTSISAPEEIRSNETLTAKINVDGLIDGETAYATLALVDEGILNLTDFEIPDPAQYYFGQRKLGVELRDVYGRLIDGLKGRAGVIREGGDAMGLRFQASPPSTEQLLSLFSGVVTLDENGESVVTFKMPEFTGSAQLMAVVWSDYGIGQADKSIQVRDPVVITASAPHFMTPGDKTRLLLEFTHISGPSGDMAVNVLSDSRIQLDHTAIPTTISLDDGQRLALSIPIEAREIGDAKIVVDVNLPNGEILSKTVHLNVIVNDPLSLISKKLTLAPGESFTFNRTLLEGFYDHSADAMFSVGPLARFDVPGLLTSLNLYPYGCTEQLTAKALPLLYFDELATALELDGPVVAEKINRSIRSILLNQSSNGSFGLWYPGSGDLWLDAYVTDFLSRAKTLGYEVPDESFSLALNNLRNAINYAGDFENGGEGLAFALMVLARERAASIGDMRYYADVKHTNFATPLALAQLALGLHYYGDSIRSEALFRRAEQRLLQSVMKHENNQWRVDYGSHFRDAAALLALAAEAGSESFDKQKWIDFITPSATISTARSTQENVWTLLAAHALLNENESEALEITGAAHSDSLVYRLKDAIHDDKGITVQNNTNVDKVISLTQQGLSLLPTEKSSNGYDIQRQYYSLDGEIADRQTLHINERYVVVLTVQPYLNNRARLMVNDPLPAGLEIDNPNLLQSGDVSSLEWLSLNAYPNRSEFRKRQFFAAIDWSGNKSFTLAYIVRAISPGQFHQPEATVEDMYRPEFRAQTADTIVKISNIK